MKNNPRNLYLLETVCTFGSTSEYLQNPLVILVVEAWPQSLSSFSSNCIVITHKCALPSCILLYCNISMHLLSSIFNNLSLLSKSKAVW